MVTPDRLDANVGGEATALIGGLTVTLRDPVDLPWPCVLAALGSVSDFRWQVVVVDGGLSHRSLCLLRERWVARHDLPPRSDAERLAFLVNRYGQQIELDLLPGIDLGAEWRSRRWRRLLSLIDSLPTHSLTVEAMAQDDEMVEATMTGKPPKPGPPPLSQETPELQMLRVIAERVDGAARVLSAANGGKPSQGEPLPRPVTAVDRIKEKRNRQSFDELALMLWPAGEVPEPPPERPRDARGRFVRRG